MEKERAGYDSLVFLPFFAILQSGDLLAFYREIWGIYTSNHSNALFNIRDGLKTYMNVANFYAMNFILVLNTSFGNSEKLTRHNSFPEVPRKDLR